jgi:hydroxymethylbilane synthase
MLALWQARWVADRLAAGMPGLRVRTEIVKTQGDVANQAPLWQIGGGGLFVKELERALLAEQIDFAVHSMKDLPSAMEPGLVVAAVPEREDPRDVGVSRHRVPISQLPTGARLGTSSSRRRAQLLAFRPDLEIVPLRGNLDTRLRKSEGDDLDAVVLAAAGILRLGYADRITEYVSPEICLPAIGQGALAVQCRVGDREVVKVLASLDHGPSRAATEAERSLMRALGGGCQIPMAALCRLEGEGLVMEGLVASPDGRKVIRVRESGSAADPVGLGEKAARELERRGAGQLLAEAGS